MVNVNDENNGEKLFLELWTDRLGTETVNRILNECRRGAIVTDLLSKERYMQTEVDNKSRSSDETYEDGYFSIGDE